MVKNLANTPVREATWSADNERLDRALTRMNLVRSRSQAGTQIASGKVQINGVIASKPSAIVKSGDLVAVQSGDEYVSRAANKLLHALDEFAIDVRNTFALDVGASTGGFTQVLLERGASRVVALDVGHDQLDTQLRADSRVQVIEGCNARELSRELFAQLTSSQDLPEIIVCDVSFISLTLLLGRLAQLASPKTSIVLLVKPQFEVGRTGIKSGIVVDPALARDAVIRVIDAASSFGLQCQGVTESPITGQHGNREVLCFFTSAPDRVSDTREWNHYVAKLFGTGGAT